MRTTLYVSASVAIVCASLSAQILPPRAAQDSSAPFLAQLADPDAERRAIAACALRQRVWAGPDSAEPLARLLADATPVPIVCPQFDDDALFGLAPLRTTPGREAARSLAALGEAGMEPLLQSARSANRDVRRHALRGLAAVRDARSVGALVSAAGDSDALVRREVAAGLRGLSGGGVTEALSRLAGDQDSAVRARAVQSLGASRTADVIPLLLTALADREPDVRSRAAAALGRIQRQR